jgi:hypothetical protein
MQDAIKIYRMMRYLSGIEYANSIKAMYSDLNQSGFYFSLFDCEPIAIHKNDCDYKFIEVRYSLFIVRHTKKGEPVERKQLKKWWTIYCMTKKDISYNEWKEDNIWVSDSSCDVSGILEACNIEINKLDYFLHSNN